MYAVESASSGWSEYWKNEIQNLERKKEKLPTLREIIEVYRNHRRLDSAQKARSQHGSYAASFKGEPIDKPKSEDKPKSDTRSDKKEWTKPCICGLLHPWRKCFYLIESIRPSGWKPNDSKMQLVEQKLAEASPEFKALIDQLRSQA